MAEKRASQRIAVVTGGMGGLGETISTKMASAGYRVVVTYSPSNTKYRSWLEEMKGKGFSFNAFPVDVVDYDDCARICARIQSASVMRLNTESRVMPALLIRISTGPTTERTW